MYRQWPIVKAPGKTKVIRWGTFTVVIAGSGFLYKFLKIICRMYVRECFQFHGENRYLMAVVFFKEDKKLQKTEYSFWYVLLFH